MKEIIFKTCVRRTQKDMLAYYERRFANFQTDTIYVSEMSPMSPKNGGFAAREFWRTASEDEARRTFYPVWFKNASWYGASQYYIKDRHEGGRNTPKPTVIVGCGTGTYCK